MTTLCFLPFSYTEGSLYTYSEYTYDETYNYVTSEKDGRGNTKTYTYDAHGNKTSETDANGSITRYEYNSKDELTKMYNDLNGNGVCDEGERAVDYVYDANGNVSSVSANDRAYSYTYTSDDAEKIASVLVGDTSIISYEYDGEKITKITYANGSTITYKYNSLDKIEEILYNAHRSIERYSYTYNDSGLLEKVWILGMDAGYFYSYDEDENLILTEFKYLDTSTTPSTYKTLLFIRSDVNDEEKIGFGYEFGSVKLGYEITTEDNKITTRLNNIKNENRPSGIFTKTTTTDALGRTVSDVLADNRNGGGMSATYEYVRGTVTDSNGNAAATSLISKIVYSDGSEIAYTYDENGNILTESRKEYESYPMNLTESYSYDTLGQLIRHDSVSQNKTFTYEYDGNGNILSIKEYAYSIGTLPAAPMSSMVYSYSDADWKDKLTSYNGEEITYDENGNPLSYRNGMRFTWNGRRLARILKDNVPIAFTYNEDGIRIMKEYYGVKTRYLLDGSNIVAQEVTNGTSLDYAYFFYDASGSPVGMNYLGNNYFYKKNIQGDIIEIWGTEDGSSSHSFRKLVSYTYDAWGNIVQMDDSTDNWYKIGTANPFRYRGYYYDNETGFYYLQSRYYDPVTGRFLNADSIEYLFSGTVQAYSYCSNSPINFVDNSGHKPWYLKRTKSRTLRGMKGLGGALRDTPKATVELPIFVGAETYLRKKGWKYSAYFLEYSTGSNPRDLYFNQNSELSLILRGSSEVQSLYRQFVSSKRKNAEYSIKFENGDMFGAFHKANITFEKKGNRYYATLSDKYDFDRGKFSNILIDFANKYAFFAQAIGVVKNYNIIVNISFSLRISNVVRRNGGLIAK